MHYGQTNEKIIFIFYLFNAVFSTYTWISINMSTCSWVSKPNFNNLTFYAPRKISGEHIVAVVSVRPSGLISPKPFIINWYNLPQMFLVTKACDPRLSRSFWKGQGHSELINIPYFNSFLTYKFTPPNPFIIDSS